MARVINIRPGEEITIRCAEEGAANENAMNIVEEGGAKKGRKSRKTRKNRKEGASAQEGGGKKRKASGFMRFSSEMRKTIGAEDPKMRSDVVAMAKEIGKRWRSMSDAEKAKY